MTSGSTAAVQQQFVAAVAAVAAVAVEAVAAAAAAAAAACQHCTREARCGIDDGKAPYRIVAPGVRGRYLAPAARAGGLPVHDPLLAGCAGPPLRLSARTQASKVPFRPASSSLLNHRLHHQKNKTSPPPREAGPVPVHLLSLLLPLVVTDLPPTSCFFFPLPPPVPASLASS